MVEREESTERGSSVLVEDGRRFWAKRENGTGEMEMR